MSLDVTLFDENDCDKMVFVGSVFILIFVILFGA